MAAEKHKILVMKMGYSETLAPYVRATCSLGDVFRTTPVLHLFKNDRVTWLTDEAAIPLLDRNPYIERILPFNLMSVLQLEEERFDKVINLEKVPGICALAGRIGAWSRYGFRLDQDTGKAKAYDRAYEALAVATREDVKKLNDKPWIHFLFRMLGATWRGEDYVLGYEPKTKVTHDIGFNVHVGRLMPVKAWPMRHWKALERMARGKYSVAWQESLDDLYGYMDWINTCRVLVTNDSLGLFLGVALGKRVIALFGSTSATEHSPHPNLRTLVPPLRRECMPCCKTECALGDPCIDHITPRMVFDAVEDWGLG